ncbi:hypothetical protein B0H34DRAFT_351884 [Crassisporium funariophilum]|nr:hypothetical protein B0H34DRAFT_351884 [Crassisporium funariophilum]
MSKYNTSQTITDAAENSGMTASTPFAIETIWQCTWRNRTQLIGYCMPQNELVLTEPAAAQVLGPRIFSTSDPLQRRCSFMN